MMEYGRNFLNRTGRDVTVIADGNFSGMKSGGVSLYGASIPTNGTGSALTLKDDTIVPVNAAYMRFGQILCEITNGETDTITGTATGGTFTVTVNGVATSAQAFNVATATLQTQLAALASVGSGNVTVTGTAGTSYVLTFAAALGPVTVTIGVGSLTGGTATIARGLSGSFANYYGPFDPAATDGRQNLNRGQCFILNRTWVDQPEIEGFGFGSAHPPVFDRGHVWFSRIVQSGVGSHTLAAGPTKAEFLAAFPGVSFADL